MQDEAVLDFGVKSKIHVSTKFRLNKRLPGMMQINISYTLLQ